MAIYDGEYIMNNINKFEINKQDVYMLLKNFFTGILLNNYEDYTNMDCLLEKIKSIDKSKLSLISKTICNRLLNVI